MARYTAYLSLGSNLEPRERNLDAALAALRHSSGIVDVRESQRHHTAPVGEGYGGEFLNSAVALSCDMDPTDLLRVTRGIEAALGRDRSRADRTVDIDIVLMRDADGQWVRHTPDPDLPHPRMHLREFVLRPLSELLPPTEIQRALQS